MPTLLEQLNRPPADPQAVRALVGQAQARLAELERPPWELEDDTLSTLSRRLDAAEARQIVARLDRLRPLLAASPLTCSPVSCPEC